MTCTVEHEFPRFKFTHSKVLQTHFRVFSDKVSGFTISLFWLILYKYVLPRKCLGAWAVLLYICLCTDRSCMVCIIRHVCIKEHQGLYKN